MDITLYTMNKRNNSTLRPSSSGRKIYVHLKEGTNIINPSFILSATKLTEALNPTNPDVEDNAKVRSYNYVYVPSFNRYYYITNYQILDNDRLQIDCTVDVLASWKDDIKVSTHLFTRTPYKNNLVLEDSIPLSKEESVSKNTIAVWNDVTSIGIYIDIAGKATASCNPTTSTYFMSIGTLKALMGKVFDPTTYSTETTGQQVMDLVSQTICNPSQYIVGCRIGRLNTHGNAVSTIRFGWLDVPVEGAYVVQDGNYVYKITRNITFPDYVNDSNKMYLLYIPCVGTVKLSPNDAYGTISVELDIDMHSGEGFAYVKNGKGKLIYSGSGAFMVNMPISGVTARNPSLLNGILAGATNLMESMSKDSGFQTNYDVALRVMNGELVSGNEMSFGKSQVSIVDSVKTGINASLERTVHTVGGSGTLAELFSHSNIEAYTLTNARLTDNNGMGYANYKRGTVTDNGYYRASYTELKTTALSGERSSIISMLYSGFYFE